jgi:hypothetical protein
MHVAAGGALIADECASTDGAQGHAMGECVSTAAAELVLADTGARRQAYPSSATARRLATAAAAANASYASLRMRAAERRSHAPSAARNADADLSILHPIKPAMGAHAWEHFWRLLRELPSGRPPPRLQLMRVAWRGELGGAQERAATRSRPTATLIDGAPVARRTRSAP